jgi:hypothetical protein
MSKQKSFSVYCEQARGDLCANGLPIFLSG